MTSKGSAQLIQFRSDLKNIISDLETIESGIRKDFKNVGNERCADSIQSVINKFQSSLNTLNSIDASLLDTLENEAQAALTQNS